MLLYIPMRKRKKLYPYLIAGLVGLLLFALFVDVTDPSYSFRVSSITISTIVIFFALSLATLFALFSFVFLNRRRGILASLLINSVLLLRSFGYKNIFSDIVIVLIFVLIELSFTQRVPKTPPQKTRLEQ